MSKISNSEQAIEWAKTNQNAVVKRDCELSVLITSKYSNVEKLFGNYWSELMVVVGVNEKDFSLIFKPLSTLDAVKHEFPRSNEEYVASPDECPFCGSANITAPGDHAIEGSSLFSKCTCLSCEKEWDETYHLVGYGRT